MSPHQYLDRQTRGVMTEALFADRLIAFLYSETRENAPRLFRALTSSRASSLLGYVNFDLPLASSLLGSSRFLRSCGVDLSECIDDPRSFTTARKIFERQIRYWECRPMVDDDAAIVSPADSKVLVGSLERNSALYLKGKFFELNELLGEDKTHWRDAFADGDFAVFRLTPEKYHYNHAPVAGRVVDFYEIRGVYHSCNPRAVIEIVSPYSKNKRVVTVIDTDVPGGSRVGFVAMIEVVALMIGEVVQCHSQQLYENSRPVLPGMFLRKGAPKSLYRPGSSTNVLLFQRGRVQFAGDLVRNMRRSDARSLFTAGFGQPLAETDAKVRSHIATRVPQG